MTAIASGPPRKPNLGQQAVREIARTRPGAWLLARLLRPVDHLVLSLTGGRTTFTAIAAGLPIIVLETIGSRTGLPRSATVVGIPIGEATAVVAGDFGRPREPAWSRNLLADPRATIVVRERRRSVVARRLVGPERRSVLDAAVRTYPPYATYLARVHGREVPLYMLEPPVSQGG